MPHDSAPQPAFIITDGGLAALLAAWTEGVCGAAPGPGVTGPLLWFTGDQTGPALAAATRQAELCHASEFLPAPAIDPGAAESPSLSAPGLLQTQTLLAAATEAARRGLSRIIWPVQLGHASPPYDPAALDLHTIADACDRALLVSQLLQLDLKGGRELTIETPYADFTDLQLAELALDLDAPLAIGAAWWCERPADRACRVCAACRRWTDAFTAAGMPRVLDLPAPAVTIGTRSPQAV